MLRPRPARGTQVNIGEAVGVIAAQSIGEPGNPAHHAYVPHRRAAQVAEQSVMESAHDGSIHLMNRNTVKNAQGELIVMSRNMHFVVVDEEGKERQSFKLPFGASEG